MYALHQILINLTKQFSANQKLDLLVAAIFSFSSGQNQKLYKGTSTDAPYQILMNLDKPFQRRKFSNVSADQKQESSMDSNKGKMKKPYKGPFTDAPDKKLIHLTKQFQRRRPFNVSTSQKHESSMATVFCLIQIK